MTVLELMIGLSAVMFCAQVFFCMRFEQMRWYWALYSAVVMYAAVVVLMAVLANLDAIFPQILLKV
jgi:hypothetical protein